ncbi:MAG: efflux transporter outer membrane subunit [Alphaproteobacteria bacterium]|nr:efflux transporter outer membrane subunit [Alphaproteobacteria bacterium]
MQKTTFPQQIKKIEDNMRYQTRLNRPVTATALLLVLVLMGGCAVGPDFKTPAAPNVTSYGPDGLPLKTQSSPAELGGEQRFVAGGDVPAAWWTLFGSAPLNNMIDVAVRSNATLESARAALRMTEETAAAGAGSFFPTIDGGATSQRSESSGSSKPYTLYNTSVSVSYIPDVFGGTRRNVESLQAKAEAQKFELEAAYLTLTSNVVTTAIQEASLREQIKASKDIITAQKKQLELMKTQLDVGAIARPAYLSQISTVATSEAALPALEQQLAASRHLMSVLMGQFPSQEIAARFDFSGLKLPQDLPISLPSKLVEQRPDIRAARANLQAANADIGVAMAAMLPQFTLTGSYGVGAARMSDMFSPTTALWGLAAGIAQPIFHGGELLHNKRASEAAFDQSAAQYRAVVLAAFQNVADSLKALESDAQTLKAQLEAEQSAAQTLDMVQQQFKAGAVSYIDLLNAQTTYQQAKIAAIKAKAARLSDTAALFQSLGGGWWQRSQPITK